MSITVKDASGNNQTINTINPNGLTTAANSQPVVIASDQAAVPVANKLYSITQTAVTVTTTSQQLVAANTSRLFLSWMVVGTADVTVGAGNSPVQPGIGMIYQSSGASAQGASQDFPAGAPSNAFQCIALAAGSTLIVWEGV